jgi:two-component system, LytTR family, sensor kinase
VTSPGSGPSAAHADAPPEVRVDWRIPTAVAAGLVLLFTVQNSIAPPGPRVNTSFGRTFGVQVVHWGAWLVLSPLIFASARRWRRRPRLTAGSVLRQFLTSLGVAFLHSAVAGTTRWALGWTENYELADVILATGFSNFGSNVLRYWLIASAYHAVAYHREVRDRDVRAARLEASLARARLDSLQGRLHPHFLFNTLNSIGALIREDPAAAERMLGSLSELLRASLNAEPSREVTLERELDLLRQYVSIQQMRFQDRLSVSIETAPDVMHAYVPHLVLQPLVENAIRHGIAPREAAGHVRIAAGRDGERLRLVVEDDGVGVTHDSPQEGGGFGLSGTRARLEQLYGRQASLALHPRTPSGVSAVVDLPFHTAPLAVAD